MSCFICWGLSLMTIAVAIKINNGLVLATDSASVIGEIDEDQAKVYHTYYNADKLFNLKKGEPIGCLTWGDGSINGVSISTLTKDFREKIKDIDTVNVENIAEEFSSFFEEILEEPSDVNVGFLIAGYSDDNGHTPEMYIIEIEKGVLSNRMPIIVNNDFSISWFGLEDYFSRFIFGIDPLIVPLLTEKEIVDEDTANRIVECCKENLKIPLGTSEMPIQDAIDLIKFLINIAESTSMFLPGPQLVGGPVDIAVITKHEGFKWIQRKHYYTQDLNIN